ncbi:MAG: phosphate/phosphite/phosphonate ABC transporter substrate-binding protein, partial [Candidatus Binatia bacterium]
HYRSRWEVGFMYCYKRLSILSFLPLYLLLALAFRHSIAAEERSLVFGRVHDDPVRSIRDRQEFVDYIAKKLVPLGITGGRIVVVEKMHLLARAIKEGKVDLFHDSVVPTVVLSKWSGSVPILRQWKYGEAEYEGVILVRKNSGIDTLSHLKGRVIAFDEPHSTSAHILPRMLLADKKLKLMQMTTPGGTKADAVGFVYGSDGSAANLLITGRVDAAATSYRELEELRPDVKETLKVIGRTRSVPRQLLSVRKDLDPNIAKALREVLLNMDKDPEGREVLRKQQKTTKIDEIPPGSLEQLKPIERFVFSVLGKEVDSW